MQSLSAKPIEKAPLELASDAIHVPTRATEEGLLLAFPHYELKLDTDFKDLHPLAGSRLWVDIELPPRTLLESLRQALLEAFRPT